MANQVPPSRPWMRLASMRASPPPPPPTPAPETQAQSQAQAPAQAQAQLQGQAQVQAQPQPPPPPPPAPAPAPVLAPVAARPIVRPAFQRPATQPLQPPPPPPTATTGPSLFRLGSISVPNSPVKTTTSLPPSPVVTRPGVSSIPPSPVQKAITTSVTTSPIQKSPKPKSSTFPTTKTISTIPPPGTTTTTITTTTYTTERITEPPPAPEPTPAYVPPPAVAAPQIFKLPARTTPPAEKAKPAAPPPSPLLLPAQAKSAPEPFEQKTVVVEKPKSPFKPSLSGLQRDAGGNTVKPGIVSDTKDQKDNLKKLADSDDATTKIITLAGDNTGAVMELSPAGKKLDPAEGRKTGPRSWWGSKLGNDSSSSDEEKSKKKDKAPNKTGTPSPPMNAFMNSNVQAVNNSILFNASCHHNDPGVHVFFTRRATGGRALHLKDGGDGQDK